jgi:adenylosuccinate lyase
MRDNLEMTHGVIFSQMVLLKLIDKGMSREDAYAVVQKNAMKSWQEGVAFQGLLLEDRKVMSLVSRDDLASVFKTENFIRHIDYIFNRVFGTSS